MAGKVTKVEILKNETPKWDRIFWHSRQFLVMELNFLGLETRKYMFYHQINGTTFFLAYFWSLEYILEIFRAQLANIFRKNARGYRHINDVDRHINRFRKKKLSDIIRQNEWEKIVKNRFQAWNLTWEIDENYRVLQKCYSFKCIFKIHLTELPSETF